MMSSEIRFIDFSIIHLTKQEKKALRSVCEKPRRIAKSEDYEVYERLAELGLVESYESGDPAVDMRHGVFPTEMGKEYLDYASRTKRRMTVDMIKWIVPVVLSILALLLAIRANTGVRYSAGTARTTAVSTQTGQPATLPNSTTQAAPQSNTPAQQAPMGTTNNAAGNTAGQPNSSTSGEPGASGEAS